MQALRAERLQELTIYVGEPHCFLVCRSCRIVLPLSCIPSHFHKNKAHAYNSRGLVDAVEAWKTIYLPDYPIKFLTEDDARKCAHPAPTSAPIVELPIHYAFHCRFIDLATENRCPRILSSRSRIRAHYIKSHGPVRSRRASGLSIAQQIKQVQEEPWEPNVPCQRLYRTGRTSTLWRVATASNNAPQPLPTSLPEDKHRDVGADGYAQDTPSA